MYTLVSLVNEIIRLYTIVVIAQVVLSWLVMLGVVDRYNRIVATIGDTLFKLTEPVLGPTRRVLDRIGLGATGIDFSPLIVILLLSYIPSFLEEMLLPVAAPYIR